MESAHETLLKTLENNELYKKICADIEKAVLNGVNEVNVGYLIKKPDDYHNNRFIFDFFRRKQYNIDYHKYDENYYSITISW